MVLKASLPSFRLEVGMVLAFNLFWFTLRFLYVWNTRRKGTAAQRTI